MTRDEARNKFYMALMRNPPETQVNSFNWCGGVVDGLVGLGVLKVDSGIRSPLEALALSISLAESSGTLTADKVAGHLEVFGFRVAKK